MVRGRVDEQALRALLARHAPTDPPPVFAVDVSVWPRCDAETSPERGVYYHLSRHSAGQPIVAGWVYQWIAQLSFSRDSWTAPLEVRRLHPTENANTVAVQQLPALLCRLSLDPQLGMPLLVFDVGYDPVQLSLGVANLRAAVLVRLRSDRCFYADPPPVGAATGRPRRHGAKFVYKAPSTWPTPTAELAVADDQYGAVGSVPGLASMPCPKRIRPVTPGLRVPWTGAWCSWSKSLACPNGRNVHSNSGCGSMVRVRRTSPCCSERISGASTWK